MGNSYGISFYYLLHNKMSTFLVIFLVSIFILTIIGFLFLVFYKRRKGINERKTNYRGICSFDIDKTLTCGKFSDLKAAVQECKDKDYALTIVTARPLPILYPVDTKKLGFPDYFQLKYGKLSFSEKAHAERKAKQLNELLHYFNSRQKSKISRRDVYLFDDKKINVDAANEAGFRGVHVENCNLDREMVMKAFRDRS